MRRLAAALGVGIVGVRPRYRINGGPELTAETTDVLFMVCADDPKPLSCDAA